MSFQTEPAHCLLEERDRNEKMLQVVPPPTQFPALEDGEEREDPGGAWRGEGLEHWCHLWCTQLK